MEFHFRHFPTASTTRSKDLNQILQKSCHQETVFRKFERVLCGEFFSTPDA